MLDNTLSSPLLDAGAQKVRSVRSAPRRAYASARNSMFLRTMWFDRDSGVVKYTRLTFGGEGGLTAATVVRAMLVQPRVSENETSRSLGLGGGKCWICQPWCCRSKVLLRRIILYQFVSLHMLPRSRWKVEAETGPTLVVIMAA